MSMAYCWVDATRIERGDVILTPNAASPHLIYASTPVVSTWVEDDGFIYVMTEGDNYRFEDGQTVTVLRNV